MLNIRRTGKGMTAERRRDDSGAITIGGKKALLGIAAVMAGAGVLLIIIRFFLI
jgi:hypothetical protein